MNCVGSSGDFTGSSSGIEPTTSSGDRGDETSMTTEDTSTTGMTGTSTTTEGTSTTTIGPVAVCGNGDIEDAEECDGTDWNGATCESLMQVPGLLGCTEGCTFDLTGCVPPGMVLVPGGVFEMGSADYPEYPVRQVQVDAFWIDETEVTVQAYAACVDDGSCSEPSAETYCNWTEAAREDHPVNCVTWVQFID